MYYAPPRAPDKLGMPVLGYFAVVGGVLTALLFAADAYMVKPTKLSFASNFYGLPAEFRGEPGTRRPQPAPELALAAETTGSAPAAEPQHVAAAPQPAPAAAKPAKQPQRKVVVHKRQPRQEEDDWFGNNNRRDFASSRDPFAANYREREPSWRDTWASGSFDQQRERPGRRASRQNNDFWSFR